MTLLSGDTSVYQTVVVRIVAVADGGLACVAGEFALGVVDWVHLRLVCGFFVLVFQDKCESRLYGGRDSKVERCERDVILVSKRTGSILLENISHVYVCLAGVVATTLPLLPSVVKQN